MQCVGGTVTTNALTTSLIAWPAHVKCMWWGLEPLLYDELVCHADHPSHSIHCTPRLSSPLSPARRSRSLSWGMNPHAKKNAWPTPSSSSICPQNKRVLLCTRVVAITWSPAPIQICLHVVDPNVFSMSLELTKSSDVKPVTEPEKVFEVFTSWHLLLVWLSCLSFVAYIIVKASKTCPTHYAQDLCPSQNLFGHKAFSSLNWSRLQASRKGQSLHCSPGLSSSSLSSLSTTSTTSPLTLSPSWSSPSSIIKSMVHNWLQSVHLLNSWLVHPTLPCLLGHTLFLVFFDLAKQTGGTGLLSKTAPQIHQRTPWSWQPHHHFTQSLEPLPHENHLNLLFTKQTCCCQTTCSITGFRSLPPLVCLSLVLFFLFLSLLLGT